MNRVSTNTYLWKKAGKGREEVECLAHRMTKQTIKWIDTRMTWSRRGSIPRTGPGEGEQGDELVDPKWAVA